MKRLPLITVGVPCYNGERYLSDTLLSILDQDYQNLEIILSDDHSTDQTAEICQKFQARDNRIRVFRNEKRLGMFPNFNRIFRLSGGEYFIWLGQHDRLDPNFISASLEELISRPEAVLCSGQFMHPNENDHVVGISPVNFDTAGLSRTARFENMLNEPLSCFAIYSLLRACAVRQTHLFQDAYFSDLVFFAELALYGGFCSTSKAFMHFRTFLKRDLEEGGNERMRVERLLTPSRANSMTGLVMSRFPFAQSCAASLKTVYQCPALSWKEKSALTPKVIKRWKQNIAREFTTRWIPRKTRKFLKTYVSS